MTGLFHWGSRNKCCLFAALLWGESSTSTIKLVTASTVTQNSSNDASKLKVYLFVEEK